MLYSLRTSCHDFLRAIHAFQTQVGRLAIHTYLQRTTQVSTISIMVLLGRPKPGLRDEASALTEEDGSGGERGGWQRVCQLPDGDERHRNQRGTHHRAPLASHRQADG